MERKDQLPYIVSADIQLVTKEWTTRKGFSMPSATTFCDVRADFNKYMATLFPNYQFIPEDELQQGMNQAIEESGLFPISLDRVYCPSQPNLDITRLIDSAGGDRGLGRRDSAVGLREQINSITAANVKEAVLIDDVIFTGDLTERVIKLLEKQGIKVPLTVTGVSVGMGMQKLQERGIEVRAIRAYEDVIDEICERDFYPGLPFSGRTLFEDRKVGIPYTLPFGNPGKWASIPESAQSDLAQLCYRQTVQLVKAIEEASGKEVLCQDLDRFVIGLPQDKTRFIDAYREVMQR